MTFLPIRLALLVPALVLAGGATSACAAGPGSSSSGGGSLAPITVEELDELQLTDAWEAVQWLRPTWLRSRGSTSMQDPTPLTAVVYVDGTRRGGLDELRLVAASDVDEIRFLSGTDATTRFGTGHAGGVIEVRTRR